MLETIIGFAKDLVLKAGAFVAGLTTAAVIATPTSLPVVEVQTPEPVPTVESASTSSLVSTTCSVTVNGETKTYSYESNSDSQTVICGSQNGQSFSNKVDTGELIQKIDGGAQNIKDTLKSIFPNLGLK
jgi:hypothetical protein